MVNNFSLVEHLSISCEASLEICHARGPALNLPGNAPKDMYAAAIHVSLQAIVQTLDAATEYTYCWRAYLRKDAYKIRQIRLPTETPSEEVERRSACDCRAYASSPSS